MELVNGQTVWTVWVSVNHGDAKVFISTGVVEHAGAGVLRMATGETRTIYKFLESVFPTEAEARSWAAGRLEQIAEAIGAEAKTQREAAAEVAAKAAVVYA